MRNFGVVAALLLVQVMAGCAAKDGSAGGSSGVNTGGSTGITAGGSSGVTAGGTSGTPSSTASGGVSGSNAGGSTPSPVEGLTAGGEAGTTPAAGGNSSGGTGGATSPGGASSGGGSTALTAGGAAGTAQGGTAGTAQGGTAQGGASAGGRVNLALMQMATASSVEHAGHEPNMINDGDQVTRWVGGTAVYPQWNQIDLGAPHNVDTVIVWPYMLRAYQFLLEGSLDGTTYFTLADEQANTMGGDSIPVGFPPQSTRYVRITITGASVYMDGWSAIDELEIYEAP